MTNFGDFSSCSKLLHDGETRSLKNRPDMNTILLQLYHVYIEGATFIPVKATVSMLKDNCDVSIEVRFESKNIADIGITKKIKRSRQSEIYPLPKCNSYGADMHVVSKYQWSSAIGRGASMLWLISALLINIGELWKSTTERDMYKA
eukprot:4742930-Ditylum_brightwellii.AAC.1